MDQLLRDKKKKLKLRLSLFKLFCKKKSNYSSECLETIECFKKAHLFRWRDFRNASQSVQLTKFNYKEIKMDVSKI